MFLGKTRCSIRLSLSATLALASVLITNQYSLATTLPTTGSAEQAKPTASTNTAGTKPTDYTAGSTAAAPAKSLDDEDDASVPSATLEVGTKSDELVTTDDVALARKQVESFPDNPEAHFVLAVALTRTSYVEEALQEVRTARRLAASKGGAQYFDNLINTYEKMLTYSPNELRVRYSLSWALYMKAYLLAQQSEQLTRDKACWAMVQQLQAANVPVNDIQKAAMQVQSGKMAPEDVLANFKAKRPLTNQGSKQITIDDAAKAIASRAGISNVPNSIKPIQGALDKADPSMAPEIKKYFDGALKQLDEIIAQKPNDVWARVYRAHLKAEYTGNLEEAMNTWRQCQKMAADNPAPYFFLGEGYLKQGNLKESVNNISKAVALRALGK